MGDSWLFDPAHETTDISPQKTQRNKPHHLLRVTDRELELAILCLAGGQGMALGVNPIRNSSGFPIILGDRLYAYPLPILNFHLLVCL